MTDIIKILSVFAIIIILLRLRLNLGGTMLIASAALGALYSLTPLEQAKVVITSSVDPVALNLLGALVLIMVLENIIRKRGLLKQMTESLSAIAGDRRVTMAVLPGIIGLLPSAGGAAFSAPMVAEAAGGAKIEPEQSALINYWFRHIWEYISPLYPGIVLAAAVTKMELNDLMLSQLPLPVAVVMVGALLCFKGVSVQKTETGADLQQIRPLFISLLPIIASIVMVAAFGMNLSLTMAIIVFALFLVYRYTIADVWTALKESVSLNVILMVLGIMIFKGMLETTGSVDSLPLFFSQSGLPPAVILFVLPFLVGLLTGLTVGFVGATFPIIMAMMAGRPDPGTITFAFAAGFAGVMLSPTHLCLLLTVRYFKADLAKTYRLLYLPVLLVFIVGLVRFWIG